MCPTLEPSEEAPALAQEPGPEAAREFLLPAWPERLGQPDPAAYPALSPAERLKLLPWLTQEEAEIDDAPTAYSKHICGCIRAFYARNQEPYRVVVRLCPAARMWRDRMEWREAELRKEAAEAEKKRLEKLREEKRKADALERAGMTLPPLPPKPAPAAKAGRKRKA